VKTAAQSGKKYADILRGLSFSNNSNADRVIMNSDVTKLQFSIIMLSDERSITERYSDENRVMEEGDKVRCIELRVPDSSKGGIFNKCQKNESTIELAESLNDFINKNHATVFPYWISKLASCNNKKLTEVYFQKRADFIKTLNCRSGLENRFSQPFAMLAVTAFIAKKAGLLPACTPYYKALQNLFKQSLPYLLNTDERVIDGFDKFFAVAQDRSLYPLDLSRKSGETFLLLSGRSLELDRA